MTTEQILNLAKALYPDVAQEAEHNHEIVFCLLVDVAKAYENTGPSRDSMLQGLVENLEMDDEPPMVILLKPWDCPEPPRYNGPDGIFEDYPDKE